MGHVEAAHLEYYLPDGRVLLGDVSFRVGEGAAVALVGANGAGKTTLLRLIAGELKPDGGTVTVSGGLGVMRAVRRLGARRPHGARPAGVGGPPADPAGGRGGGRRRAGDHGAGRRAGPAGLRAGARRLGARPAATRPRRSGTCAPSPRSASPTSGRSGARSRTLSGGEQKRLVLEALLRGPDEVLLLDEPDNYLDVPGKRWLEEQLAADPQDGAVRQPRPRAAVPRPPSRSSAWSRGRPAATCGCTAAASPPTTRPARSASPASRSCAAAGTRSTPSSRQLVLHAAAAGGDQPRTWPPATTAAQTRLRKFEEAGPPPEPPREQDIRMRLRGGRTGVRAVTCEQLELTGLMQPFDLEVFYGERVAVLGSNGSGKSHFLRLLAGEDGRAHRRRGSSAPGSCPGHFAQTHAHPELLRPHRWWTSCGPSTRRDRGRAMTRAAPLRAGAAGRPALRARCPAASRPGSRSCCWSCPAPPRCCSTSRPTTWTWRAPRRCRRAWRRTTARCSRSPTTAGSPASFDRFLVFGSDGRVLRGARAGLGRGAGWSASGSGAARVPRARDGVLTRRRLRPGILRVRAMRIGLLDLT